jgi:uncharacterized membrane protein YgdD (TMEM256/DUF423 family)
MGKKIVQTGCVFMLIGVGLAALGSHALQGKLTPKVADAFATAVQFLLLHGIAFIALGNSKLWSDLVLKRSFILLISGIICFSGSIFILTLLKVFQSSFQLFPLITPLGGVLLIIGWCYAGLSVGKK